ncbi:hypothetical protein ACN6LA_007841 [Streptomyces sp. SAS_269]|uniref:hypothetical protein n=1 Tax=Streptomyces sp. SAS_269 TaxID=3412749 RepID=UPI00403D52CF
MLLIPDSDMNRSNNGASEQEENSAGHNHANDDLRFGSDGAKDIPVGLDPVRDAAYSAVCGELHHPLCYLHKSLPGREACPSPREGPGQPVVDSKAFAHRAKRLQPNKERRLKRLFCRCVDASAIQCPRIQRKLSIPCCFHSAQTLTVHRTAT